MNRITKVTSVITLTTDFGTSDGFVGTMKGVILGINPQATIVDITHDIAPQNVEQGAFVFAAAARYFPPNAIHLVVVDPGVGSARRPIAIQAGETIYIAPDNGILSLALQSTTLAPHAHLPWGSAEGSAGVNNQKPTIPRAVHLTNPNYWLPRVSSTFHGRDIFAPCAAHLSLGVPLEEMGEPITDWVRLARVLPSRRGDDAIVGRIAHVDRFGNVITNIGEEMLEGMDRARMVIEIAGKKIMGLKRAYADVAPGELIALISSGWELEIAQREGSAAKGLGVKVGDEVVVLEHNANPPFYSPLGKGGLEG